MSTIVWVVGLYIENDCTSIGCIKSTWEIEGIYLTESDARAACKVENHFIGPVEIGKDLSGETVIWPNCVYPLLEGEQ